MQDQAFQTLQGLHLSKYEINPMEVDCDSQIIQNFLDPANPPSGVKIDILTERYEILKDQYINSSLLSWVNPIVNDPILSFKPQKQQNEGHSNINQSQNQNKDCQQIDIHHDSTQNLSSVNRFRNIKANINRITSTNISKALKDKQYHKFQAIYYYICNQKGQNPIPWDQLQQIFRQKSSRELYDYFKKLQDRWLGKIAFTQQICNKNADTPLLERNIIFLTYFIKNGKRDIQFTIREKQNLRKFRQEQVKKEYLRAASQMIAFAKKKLYDMIEKSNYNAIQIILDMANIDQKEK